MKLKNPFVILSITTIVLGVILSFILSATSADERSDGSERGKLLAQANPEMKVPPMMRKKLEGLGISEEDFKNNPEKRAKAFELMKRAKEARGARPKGEGEGRSKKAGDSKKSDKKSGGEFAYYKDIMDKNLFRPLGWAPKKEENPFSLTATMPSPNFPGDSKAIIRIGDKERTVTIGDDINGNIVKSITDDSVTLEKDGKPMELNTGGLAFLGGSSGGGKGRRGGGKQPQVTHTGGQPNKNVKQKINKMTPEQQRRMQDEMRRRRGRRGGSRGGRSFNRSGVRMRRR